MTTDLGSITPGTLVIEPVVANILPIVEECRLRAYMVTFTYGTSVLVWPDEVRFNVTRGYREPWRLKAEDIVCKAICQIAEQRHAAGNILPERRWR